MPYFITDESPDCDGWATVKADGEVMGCHGTKQASIDQMIALSIAEGIEPGGERSARQTPGSEPAPAKDQVTGSDKNKPGSAAGAGGEIELSADVRTALRNKMTEHNEAMAKDDRPQWTRTTVGQLSAVYRRGAGAFSVSHRPGMTRGQWAMARVNAYLYLLRNGRPESAKYITDYDLLPEAHPKSTRTANEVRQISVPEYMQRAAERGLELRREGFGGDGLTDQTIREARLMARGQMSDDKAKRSNAWAARHAVDLEAPKNRNTNDPEWPGAGAVAHYLWGINPLNPGPARRWLEREAEKMTEQRQIEDVRVPVPGADKFTTKAEALARAGQLGCEGTHTMDEDGQTIYMPCSTHAAYDAAKGGTSGGYDRTLPESRGKGLPENYRPATSPDVPEGRACGNCFFFNENDVAPDGRARCMKWGEYVQGGYVCNAWQANERATDMASVEFRTFGADVTEIRASEVGDGMTFGGYAWRYNAPSLPLGHGFTERIAEGAFTRSLKSRVDIRAYVNHNDELLLGSTRAKTLRIEDRPEGGYVEIDLPNTSTGNDIRVLVERGDIQGMSFGFSTVKDSWSADGAERMLLAAKIHEVSVVTGVPAYPQTTASVRKLMPLASRTATDVDELSEAMAALQAGELSPDQASLLRTVVDKVAATGEPAATVPASILAAKLTLAEKALGL